MNSNRQNRFGDFAVFFLVLTIERSSATILPIKQIGFMVY